MKQHDNSFHRRPFRRGRLVSLMLALCLLVQSLCFPITVRGDVLEGTGDVRRLLEEDAVSTGEIFEESALEASTSANRTSIEKRTEVTDPADTADLADATSMPKAADTSDTADRTDMAKRADTTQMPSSPELEVSTDAPHGTAKSVLKRSMALGDQRFSVSGRGLDHLVLRARQGETEAVKSEYFARVILGLSEDAWQDGAIHAVDLNLVDPEGETVQPEHPVEVTLEIAAEEDDETVIYHLLDDVEAIEKVASGHGDVQTFSAAGLADIFRQECAAVEKATGERDTVYYEVRSTEEGTATPNGDGTVSFTTESFSYYWTWTSPKFSRETNKTTSRIDLVSASKDKTVYIPYPQSDQVFYLDTTVYYESASPRVVAVAMKDGVDLSAQFITQPEYYKAPWDLTKETYQMTVKAGTPVGTVITVTYSDAKGREYHVNLEVARLPKPFIEDATNIPVSIAIMSNNSYIEGQPAKTTPSISKGEYVRVDAAGQVSTKDSTEYASDGYTLISKSILDDPKFVQSANGQYVWGLVDASGVQTLAELSWTPEQVDTIIANYIQYKGMDGVAAEYRLIPYVIKLEMTNGSTKPSSGAHWYVECIIVPKEKYTISYEHNLEYDYAIASGNVPPGTVVNAGDSYTVLPLEGFKATKTDDDGNTYTAEFRGWQDEEGNVYQAGEILENVQQDIVLKALWYYPDQSLGNLLIAKKVLDASPYRDPDPNQSFAFEMHLTGDHAGVTHHYDVYSSTGTLVDEGNLTSSGEGTLSHAFTLRAGDRAILYGIPQEASYTVKEGELPRGYAIAESAKTLTGKIVAGQTQMATFQNTYEGTFETLALTMNLPTGTTGDRTQAFEVAVSNAQLAGKTVSGVAFDADGVATFSLKHGDARELNLPAGLTYTIGATPVEGYTAYYQINGGEVQSAASVTLDELTTVEVLNRKAEVPNTAFDVSPPWRFVGLVGGAGVGFLALWFTRRKRRPVQ